MLGLVVVSTACGAPGSASTSETVPGANAQPVTASSSVRRPVPSVPFTSTPASVPSTTSTEPVGPTAEECIGELPLAARAGQVVWPSVYSSQLNQGPRYATWGVGGVILMDWTSAASAEAVAEFRRHSLIPLLVATDEEGGRVQRLSALGRLQAPADVARAMTPEAAGDLLRRHGALVRAAGIDVVFAPVVDVGPLTGSGPIGTRVFSSDPLAVAAYAEQYVDAWLDSGVLPVLKHFPGHGSATADSHFGRSRTATLDVLRGRDLVPYDLLADSGAAVMVGHLDTPGLTDAEGVPASVSRAAITDLLREEMGYDDVLVISDALGMKAITSLMTIADAAVRTLAAGADVAIFTNIELTPTVIKRIEAAVLSGELDVDRLNSAVSRVFKAKDVDPCLLVAKT
jgi:beta-N-acetylhexosaminidase